MDIMRNVLEALRPDAEAQLREAQLRCRERLLDIDQVLDLIESCIRARVHCTPDRPVAYGHDAERPVSTSYAYPATRTVAEVEITPAGVLKLGIERRSANGHGRATRYVAVVPEICGAPWHTAYRVDEED